MEFVPPFAPFVVLAFLGTAFLIAIAAVALLAAMLTRKPRYIFAVLGSAAALLGIYAGALVTASALSRERTLLPGEKKYFCEIDCHLAYSVEGVEAVRELGPPPHRARAVGRFHVVTLRTWFDESTISPYGRGTRPSTPIPASSTSRMRRVIGTSRLPPARAPSPRWDGLRPR